MKARSLLCSFAWCLVILLSLVQHVLAQGKVLSGKVTDEDNQDPLPGVTVQVKGTNTGTITGPDGTFKLNNVPANTKSLVFSFVGYDTKEVAYTGETELNVTLKNGKALEEVVVVGYGTQRKKDVTGAVTKITTKEFNTGVISNPLQQVQGKVAGLVIVQPGSDPNENLTVRLRGATSLEGQPPLLVVDGVAIDDFNRGINAIAPGDIESYDILRDASAAAIYGARGANGVIIITTKKGKAGKTTVEYNGYVSAEKVSNSLDVLSAAEWRAATQGNATAAALDKGANTSWPDEITQTALTHSHNVAVGGGTDKFNYRASVSYMNQEGVVLNSGKDQLSARLNINQKSFNDRLNIAVGLNTTIGNRKFLPGQDLNPRAKTVGSSNIFNLAFNYLPVWPLRNPDGTYYQVIDFDVENPVFDLKEIYNRRKDNFWQGSGKVDYELVDGLTVGVFGAISRSNDVGDYFEPTIPEKNNKSMGARYNYNKQVTNFDIHLNYKKQFGGDRHSIDFTFVHEYNRFLNDGFGVVARGFLIPPILTNNLGSNTDIRNDGPFSYKDEVLLASFLGRLVYGFDNRYSVTLNFRRDGSSKFGPNSRWGNFPSAGVAWTVSNEEFFKRQTLVNYLKFRVTYGTTGNQEDIDPYPYQLLYGAGDKFYSNGEVLQGYGINQLNNPDLKWEVRRSFNVGLDFSLFNSRLNGTVDVFSDQTKDLLFNYDLPQPPFLTNKVVANAADAENKGVEITLNGDIIKNDRFTWNAAFNISTLRNKITNLSGKFQGADLTITARNYGYADGRGLSNAYITRLVGGHPAGVFWIHEFAELRDGKEYYVHRDDKGQRLGLIRSDSATDADRIYVDPTPKFTYGFTSNFSYKNFDFSFFLRGVQGAKIFANTLLNLATTTRLPGNNVVKDALTNGFKDQPQPSTYWLKDASYLRMENMTLGYNFKPGSLWGLQSLRLYLAANNLFIITDYPGVDPEVKVEGDRRYIDRNFYPKTRSFTFGLNVTF
jgi:TonB-linked SusC/RagA family outer membrane protein